MIDLLLGPLSYSFMQRGLAAALMVGVVCSVIGCFVVLRSMAFLGDALAHAILPGVAVAYLVQGNLTIGALVAAVVVALGIGGFTRQGTIKEDTAIGILFAAALSLGIAMISSIRSYAVDLSHIMFGNVLGVSDADLWLTFGLSLVVIGLIVYFFKEFLVISFDPVLASTLRIRTTFFKNLQMILLAVTIVIALQTVGVGLVSAMLVTPAATAYLLSRRFPSMMILSAFFGGFSSILGLYISYYTNVSSGAAIVLTATIFFFLAFLFSPIRGIVWNKNGWLGGRRAYSSSD